MSRRTLLLGAGGVFLGSAAGYFGLGPASAAATMITVWKSPSCGCCGGWVDHMRRAGYRVTVVEVDDVSLIKAEKGVPDELGSCHTAVVDGYALEGHVPVEDVNRLLAERPRATGLAVPGMPQSAPGMDIPGEPYQTLLFGRSGPPVVYARH